MVTKLKSMNKKFFNYFLYILIFIFLSMSILSGVEVINNYDLILPERIYVDSYLAQEIDDYIGMALDYAIYYKNDEYVNDINNINQYEIDSYKQKIEKKIESQYQNIKSIRESSQGFHDYSYDEQQAILNEERKKIEEKYAYDEASLLEEILESKKTAYENLKVQLSAYNNIDFAAFDILSNSWITKKKADEDLIKDTKYYSIRKITTNDGVTENVYISGKKSTNSHIVNRIKRNSSGYYTSGNYVSSYIQNQSSKYYYLNNYSIELYVWIPKVLQKGDSIYSAYKSIEEIGHVIGIKIIVCLVSVAILALLLYLKKKENSRMHEVDILIDKLKKYPFEYKLGGLLLVYIAYKLIFNSYYNKILGEGRYLISFTYRNILTLSIILILLYVTVETLIVSYSEGEIFENTISKTIYYTTKDIIKRGSFIKNIFIIGIMYISTVVILLLVGIFNNGRLLWPCFIVSFLISFALLIKLIKSMVYLDKIMLGAKDAASGELTYKIEEKGKGYLSNLAHDINNIKEGLRKSLKNEMKSEKMKSELITNVSHDLKTPLTSIINYIDLLKREPIEPESARDYIAVLDSKSQRLKALIEDLFEASKAASGEMELHLAKIDIVQLLRQTLGEFDEKLTESLLEIRTNFPEEKVYVNGDGRRLFRVFENLISNITKYSLRGTRVYIDIIKDEKNAIIVMKNISSYELNFDAGEITNRFKRGDEARTTEGSGLGLAIAKSIVELHGGELNIEIDGDLFKSIIKMELYQENN